MEIEEYCNLQHSLGTVESTGGFTVVTAEALDKLSRYLLPDDSHALLRIIQGCVGLGSSEIWVDYGTHELSVCCSHPEARDVNDQLSREFGKLFLEMEDSPERDMLLGLGHLLSRKPEYVGVSRWEGGRLQTWETLTGHTPERVRNQYVGTSVGTVFCIHVKLPASAPALVLRSPKWAKLCFFCPLPIHFKNGVLGGRGDAPFEMPRALLDYHQAGDDFSQGRISPRWRGRAELNLGDDLGWTTWENGKETPNTHIRMLGKPGCKLSTFKARSSGVIESVTLVLQYPIPYCTGSLYLDRQQKGETSPVSIYPVKRGVILNPLVIPLPCPPAYVFLPCDSIATDLTGTNVQEEAQGELVYRALQLLKEGLEICCANESQLPVDLNWKDPTALAAVGASVVLTLSAAVATGIVPIFWPGVFLTSYFALWLERQYKGPGRLAVLSATLHQDIANLAAKLGAAQRGELKGSGEGKVV